MGRLIDESEAIELINGSDEITDYQKDESITCIRACNTAYDADKVVKQLETISGDQIQYEYNYEKGIVDGIDKAIEIVKGGGVDGNQTDFIQYRNGSGNSGRTEDLHKADMQRCK